MLFCLTLLHLYSSLKQLREEKIDADKKEIWSKGKELLFWWYKSLSREDSDYYCEDCNAYISSLNQIIDYFVLLETLDYPTQWLEVAEYSRIIKQFLVMTRQSLIQRSPRVLGAVSEYFLHKIYFVLQELLYAICSLSLQSVWDVELILGKVNTFLMLLYAFIPPDSYSYTYKIVPKFRVNNKKFQQIKRRVQKFLEKKEEIEFSDYLFSTIVGRKQFKKLEHLKTTRDGNSVVVLEPFTYLLYQRLNLFPNLHRNEVDKFLELISSFYHKRKIDYSELLKLDMEIRKNIAGDN